MGHFCLLSSSFWFPFLPQCARCFGGDLPKSDHWSEKCRPQSPSVALLLGHLARPLSFYDGASTWPPASRVFWFPMSLHAVNCPPWWEHTWAFPSPIICPWGFLHNYFPPTPLSFLPIHLSLSLFHEASSGSALNWFSSSHSHDSFYLPLSLSPSLDNKCLKGWNSNYSFIDGNLFNSLSNPRKKGQIPILQMRRLWPGRWNSLAL